MKSGMVIVGAGEAGARAAIALRENGWLGPITLLGAEIYHPYERPPLSKALLTAAEEQQPPFILNAERIAELSITLRCGFAVRKIDRSRHAVISKHEEEIAYERLLIATGSTSRQLNIAGATADNIHYLRNFNEALSLRAKLRPDSKLVIIGGGFIGLEVAASANARGVEVIVLECAPRLLTRGVLIEIASAIQDRHRAAGVEFRFNTVLEKTRRDGSRLGIKYSCNGESCEITCDSIVAGVGSLPDTQLAAQSGLAIDNGVATDSQLLTSDSDIFAAGDCCSFPHALYSDRRIRLESWRNAQTQGSHAGRSMLGMQESYVDVPWFWSDQYELTVQVAGLVSEGHNTVIRELPDAKIYFHLDASGRLVAASGLGRNSAIAKDIKLAEMLIAQRAKPDPSALASPQVRLKSLLAS